MTNNDRRRKEKLLAPYRRRGERIRLAVIVALWIVAAAVILWYAGVLS